MLPVTKVPFWVPITHSHVPRDFCRWGGVFGSPGPYRLVFYGTYLLLLFFFSGMMSSLYEKRRYFYCGNPWVVPKKRALETVVICSRGNSRMGPAVGGADRVVDVLARGLI